MPVELSTVLQPNALVSLDEAKAHLGIVRETTASDLAAEDQRIVEAINWVSDWVEHNVRPMARKVVTLRLRAPRGPALYLKRVPIDVLEPVELSINDAAQTVWRAEADGARRGFGALVIASNRDSVWAPDGLVVQSVAGHGYFCGCGCAGWGAGADPEPILLTYTGGFDTIPESGPNKLPADVRHAVLEVVKAWHRNEQQGTADVVQLAQPGGGPTFEVPRWMPYGALQVFLKHVPVEVI